MFDEISTWQFLIGIKGPTHFSHVTNMEKENSGIFEVEFAPRFACQTPGSSFSRFPVPVGARFRKYAIYIYQNAQNEALSVD